MIDYGSFEISLDDVVNEAFVSFSYDYREDLSIQELFILLISYGLVQLGYLKLENLPWEENSCVD